MNDFETIKEMLTRAKVDFTEIPINKEQMGYVHPAITVERGYVGFVSEFQFNKDGSLKDLSAWE